MTNDELKNRTKQILFAHIKSSRENAEFNFIKSCH